MRHPSSGTYKGCDDDESQRQVSTSLSQAEATVLTQRDVLDGPFVFVADMIMIDNRDRLCMAAL